jgi:hypothetical protein
MLAAQAPQRPMAAQTEKVVDGSGRCPTQNRNHQGGVRGTSESTVGCFARYTCTRDRAQTETYSSKWDRLCGLVVRVPGCKPTGPGFDYRRYKIFCVSVGLERGSLSFASIN